VKLTRITGECRSGDECPTVYTSDRGTVVIQGYIVADGKDLPDGEVLAEIPLRLLKDAARAIH
jgi:hypothetical protein